MAKLYVEVQGYSQKIKIGDENNYHDDVDLKIIDFITLTHGKSFFDVAYKKKCIGEEIYHSSDKTIAIKQDNQVFKEVMFDEHLRQTILHLYQNKKEEIDEDFLYFKKDMDLFFQMLKKEITLQKLSGYFKDERIVLLFKKYYLTGHGKDNISHYFKVYQNYRLLRQYLRENIYHLCLVLDESLSNYHILFSEDKDLLEDVDEEKIKDYIDENQCFFIGNKEKNSSIMFLKYGKYGMEKGGNIYLTPNDADKEEYFTFDEIIKMYGKGNVSPYGKPYHLI